MAIRDTSRQAAASSTPAPPIAVARDPVALVVQECITVTGAMRKHERWAHSSVSAILGAATIKPVSTARSSLDDAAESKKAVGGGKGETSRVALGDEEEAQASRWGLRGKKGRSMSDNPLLAAFARLRSELKGCNGMLSRAPARPVEADD